MNKFDLLHQTYRYDSETGQLWYKTPGRGRKMNKPVGSIQPSGHRKCFGFDDQGEKKADYAHRVIWEMHNGSIPYKMTIDHIDGDPDNNRIENLRLATQQQQLMNRGGWKRYHYQKTLGYSTTCTMNHLVLVFGYYETKEEALEIHKRASVTLFKEFSFFHGEAEPFENMEELNKHVIETRNLRNYKKG